MSIEGANCFKLFASNNTYITFPMANSWGVDKYLESGLWRARPFTWSESQFSAYYKVNYSVFFTQITLNVYFDPTHWDTKHTF